MSESEGLLVLFKIVAVENKSKSTAAGRPQYEDKEFIEIIPIGDNKTVFIREVTESDISRFPEQYERFKKHGSVKHQGTPLSEWPAVGASQVKMLEHSNVFTVEQLTEIDDNAIQRLGQGTRALKVKAEIYIRKARDNAVPEQLAIENDRLKTDMADLKKAVGNVPDFTEENEKLKAQVADLMAQVNTLVIQASPETKKSQKATASA